MRSILFSVFLLTGALPAQELKVIPLPRSVARLPGALVLKAPVRIALATQAPSRLTGPTAARPSST